MKRHKEQLAPAVFVFVVLITTFAAPAHAAAPIKLNGTLVAGGDVFDLQFSPDSSRILYYADQDTDGVFEIYSVTSSGGTPVKINGTLVAGGDVSFNGFQFSPDSSRVLYRADQITDNVFEIYSVPSDGGTPVKLNGALVAGGSVFSGLQFSPDSSRVLYYADQDTDQVYEIYSVASSGGTPAKLNGTLVAGGSVFFNGLQFSPDGSKVLYLADQDTDNVNEIYLVPSDGGTPVKINGTLVAGGDVSIGFQFSPDGSKILYLADQDTDGVNEAYVRIIRERANSGGGDWDSAGSWDQNVAPDEVMQVFIDTPSTVTAVGNTTTRTVNELVLGGGAGTSTLDLEAGAIITAMHGFAIRSGGVLRGDGRIVGDVSIVAGGEIRVGDSEQLQIGGASFSNSGRIEVIGTASAPAEIEFDGVVTNEEADGEIFARNALLRFNGGLTNQASFSMSFGTSDVFGDVFNVDTGTMIVSGNSNATFYDNVVNDGELRTSAGSTAVFFGDVSGTGTYTGTGTVFFEGMFSPGSSPAAVSFAGDVLLGASSTLNIELGGTIAGTEYDQLLIDGIATLGSTLDISLIDSFLPSAGDTFEILTAATILGTFDTINLPALPGDLLWFLNYSATAVELVATFSADFEEDGDVDSFDLARWEANYGSTTAAHIQGDANADQATNGLDFLAWQRQFGSGAASLASSQTVPEPSTAVLLIGLAGIGMLTGRRPYPEGVSSFSPGLRALARVIV